MPDRFNKEQRGLFDQEAETRFQVYHQENPTVYNLFKHFAFEKINKGAKHLGAKAVFERIRWETSVDTVGDDYKLNNIYTPFYARLFMNDFPEHAGIFRLRRSIADREL